MGVNHTKVNEAERKKEDFEITCLDTTSGNVLTEYWGTRGGTESGREEKRNKLTDRRRKNGGKSSRTELKRGRIRF